VRETSPHFCWVLGAEEQQSSCWLIAEQGKPFAFGSSDSSETTFYREEGRQDLSCLVLDGKWSSAARPRAVATAKTVNVLDWPTQCLEYRTTTTFSRDDLWS
jgi:hypothetical protein